MPGRNSGSVSGVAECQASGFNPRYYPLATAADAPVGRVDVYQRVALRPAQSRRPTTTSAGPLVSQHFATLLHQRSRRFLRTDDVYDRVTTWGRLSELPAHHLLTAQALPLGSRDACCQQSKESTDAYPTGHRGFRATAGSLFMRSLDKPFKQSPTNYRSQQQVNRRS
jgi:hypothetical protein